MICIPLSFQRNWVLARAARAEGGAIGLALGAGIFILHADFFSAAVIVNGVVLAAGYIAGYTGILAVVLFVAHIINLPCVGFCFFIICLCRLIIRRIHGAVHNW